MKYQPNKAMQDSFRAGRLQITLTTKNEECYILILKNTNTALKSIKNELLNGGFSIAGWVGQPTLSLDLTQAIKAYGHD